MNNDSIPETKKRIAKVLREEQDLMLLTNYAVLQSIQRGESKLHSRQLKAIHSGESSYTIDTLLLLLRRLGIKMTLSKAGKTLVLFEPGRHQPPALGSGRDSAGMHDRQGPSSAVSVDHAAQP